MKKILKFLIGKPQKESDRIPSDKNTFHNSFLLTINQDEKSLASTIDISSSVNIQDKEEKPKTLTLRSEFNFLKYPFFDISHRTSKRKTMEIKETVTTSEGTIKTLWKVYRGIERNFPSSFARRVHIEVVERTINELKKPVSRLIKLGTMSDICRKLNITISGKNSREIKNALKDISFAGIETKKTFCMKDNKGKKFFEGVFHLYDSIVLIGESLPDGEKAEAVYVLLNDMYVQNYNSSFTVPLDYQYMQKSIKGDIASRMYEVLSLWFYPALEQDKNYIQKEYSELCNYFPLTPQNEKWKAKKQLKTAHRQHIESGFIEREPEWISLDAKDDWLIKYYIGPKAVAWYHSIQKSDIDTGNHFSLIQEKDQKTDESPKNENPQLIQKLISLDIPESRAKNLIEKYSSDTLKKWIDAIEYIKPKPRNKAGFLVKALEEKWEFPEGYRKKNQKENRQREEKSKAEYQRFLIEQVDAYLKKIDSKIIEKEIEQHREIFFDKYPHYREFEHSENIIPSIENDYKAGKAREFGLISFEEWKVKGNIKEEKRE